MPQSFPLSRRQALVLAGVLLLALFLVGRRLTTHPQASAPVQPLRPAAAATGRAETAALVVHVVGAVRRPGLYRLPQGSRIDDAVRRAGGATRRADVTLVNLAAPVADGLQIVVPRRTPGGGGVAGASESLGGTAGPVSLNNATLEQLDSLPGIGPVTAQKILDYRQEHGAFTSVDELDAVPGIGPKRLAELRDVVAP